MKKIIKKITRFILLSVIKKERILTLLKIVEKEEVPAEQNDIIKILVDYGYFESIIVKLPVDKSGNPLPWYTYPAIDYLKQFDLSNKTIFEWGSGNSSLFYANRALKVYSVEDNKDWFEKISYNKPSNLELFFATGDEYTSKISELNIEFDIIVIDASQRFECAIKSIKFLKANGMIILDNSDWFKNSAKYLRENGFIQADFFGFGPINNYTWTTSIFYSRDFKFDTLGNIQPHYITGGLTHVCD